MFRVEYGIEERVSLNPKTVPAETVIVRNAFSGDVFLRRTYEIAPDNRGTVAIPEHKQWLERVS